MNAATNIPDLVRSQRAVAAVDWIRGSDDRTIQRQIELTEIPAPPFAEEVRGRWMAVCFRELGLEVSIDEVGNVLASRPGLPVGEPLIVSAHLDTVFPAKTDVRVRSIDGRLVGPGISDDGRGLAVMLTLAEALVRHDLSTKTPILFVATVGEEGEGDLRGVKHLFGQGQPGSNALGFISIDGAGLKRIVTDGVGSHRFRATLEGRGGHSWADFGTPNPIHALARVVSDWTEIGLSQNPTSTLTVARWGGGSSINAIPSEAWVELDLRSEDPTALADLRDQVQAALERILGESGADALPNHALELRIDVIGERPAGGTRPDCPLVRAAFEATRQVGEEPEAIASSTDANVAMSLGIPAVTLGGGGRAGLAHTTGEWYQNEGGPQGVIRALLTVLGVAGLG